MRNFVVAMLDALRYDVLPTSRPGWLSNHLNEQDLPALRSLASDGTVVPNLRTTHPGAEPATASLLTGLYPREHHLYGSGRLLHPDVKSLVERFSNEGFHTLLFNGHKSYIQNGIMARFDENLMGPIDRLIARIKEVNGQHTPVFAFYEPLDLRFPYLLSKFPPDKNYHVKAVEAANRLSKKMGRSHTFDETEAHFLTNEWQIPLAGGESLPVWKFLINTVHNHYETQPEIFGEPVEDLGNLYCETLKLMDDYHFKTLKRFLNEDESGKKTSVLLTSNSGDGPTQRNQRPTFGQRLKPIEDAVRVPGLFYNTQRIDSEWDESTLVSHVDLAPTIMDEFGIDYGKSEFSGHSLLKGENHSFRVFIESSTTKRNKDKHGRENLPSPSVIEWSCVLNGEGYKLYRRGLPVSNRDLQRDLPEFFRRIVAKILLKWLDAEQARGRAEKFRADDSLEMRKRLVAQIKKNRGHHELECFRWDEDAGETHDLLEALDPSCRSTIEDMLDDLENRFDDPYELETPMPEEGSPETVEFIEPLNAVGYVE